VLGSAGCKPISLHGKAGPGFETESDGPAYALQRRKGELLAEVTTYGAAFAQEQSR